MGMIQPLWHMIAVLCILLSPISSINHSVTSDLAMAKQPNKPGTALPGHSSGLESHEAEPLVGSLEPLVMVVNQW